MHVENCQSAMQSDFYLTPQMEEVVEIVGAQIRCAALGVAHVPGGGVRFGLERIEGAALGVLQGHIDPVEQLCRWVHGGTSLYSGHHIVAGGLRASWRTAPSEPPGFLDQPTSPSHPPARRLDGCDPSVLTWGGPGGPRSRDSSLLGRALWKH